MSDSRRLSFQIRPLRKRGHKWGGDRKTVISRDRCAFFWALMKRNLQGTTGTPNFPQETGGSRRGLHDAPIARNLIGRRFPQVRAPNLGVYARALGIRGGLGDRDLLVFVISDSERGTESTNRVLQDLTLTPAIEALPIFGLCSCRARCGSVGQHRSGSAATFDQARADFEQAWRSLLPKIPASAFEEYRRDREHRTEIRAIHARGEKLPSEIPSSLMRCVCGVNFDSHKPAESFDHRLHICAAQVQKDE